MSCLVLNAEFHARFEFDVEYRTEVQGGPANAVERAAEPNRPMEVTAERAAEPSKPPPLKAEPNREPSRRRSQLQGYLRYEYTYQKTKINQTAIDGAVSMYSSKFMCMVHNA